MQRTYTPEEVAMVMAAVPQFTDSTGRISWDNLMASNPEIAALNTAQNIKNLYYRNTKPRDRSSDKPRLSSGITTFTNDQDEFLRQLKREHPDNQRVNWSHMVGSGKLAELLAHYSVEQIKNRYSYLSKSAKKTSTKGNKNYPESLKIRALALIDNGVSPRDVAVKLHCKQGSIYYWMDNRKRQQTEPPDVLQARASEVARQTQPVEPKSTTQPSINYCPHCGFHIAGLTKQN